MDKAKIAQTEIHAKPVAKALNLETSSRGLSVVGTSIATGSPMVRLSLGGMLTLATGNELFFGQAIEVSVLDLPGSDWQHPNVTDPEFF
jgi:hypothetical protein